MSLYSLIIDKLNSLGLSYKKSGQDFLIAQCPNPHHNDSKPSFSINIKTGNGFCFACDYRVNKKFWVGSDYDEELEREAKYNNLLNSLIKNKENTEEVNIYLPPYSEPVPDGWRGLTRKTINKNGLYITRKGKYKDRVIFPFYKKDKCIGFVARTIVNAEPKYLYATGTQIKSVIYPQFDKANEIILVEGVMDALSLNQDGFTAIANLGLSINFNKYKIAELLKRGVNKIWLMFDEDEYGKKAYKKFFNSKELTDVFELDYAYNNPNLKDFFKSGYKDYNEYLQHK